MRKPAKTGSQPLRVEIGVEQLSQLEQLLSLTGHLPLKSYRAGCIKRRLAGRIKNLGLGSLDQYLELLGRDPLEQRKLTDALTVSVTSFFRDPETFEIVSARIAPELAAHARDLNSRVKVWSAGCCTGEEAYSLAITFLENGPGLAAADRLRIWATDIDQEAIDHARKGFYHKDRLSGLDDQKIAKYFLPLGEGYQVRPELKALAEFRRENLLAPGFSGFEGMDLIMCRNLLIYLESGEQTRLLEKFERSLRDNGFLVLGKTEFLRGPMRDRFEHVSPSERIYKKVGHALKRGAGFGPEAQPRRVQEE